MKKRPNIVVFMTDQQNADTIKPDHMAITPNIEAFEKRNLEINTEAKKMQDFFLSL